MFNAMGPGSKPAGRSSLVIVPESMYPESQEFNSKEEDDETDSFVSAPDSPSH